ncbi:hypothetical protein DFR55_10728 [Herbinix hemicellulosilytica]|uniref:ABC transporter ATP-binding protein n=1 Tax=Herbinix hemicellulosilytica TaxID=1564487 RepID=A0A0H5SIR4_HERHM|nr:hypothetical protein DFR55_10728 [Herbinix hemicellulosilytica]CRZ35397.1 hypothetical protein HHT355_2200 [Herbinix hemicellulosilytica]
MSIEIRKISKSYGNIFALDQVSFTFEEDKISVCLVETVREKPPCLIL